MRRSFRSNNANNCADCTLVYIKKLLSRPRMSITIKNIRSLTPTLTCLVNAIRGDLESMPSTRTSVGIARSIMKSVKVRKLAQ